jgi:hypothetical protein
MVSRFFRNCICSLALAGGVAMTSAANAAPTAVFNGFRTSVALSSELVGALTSLNVAPSPVFPATLRNGVAAFPIPSGELDLANAKGEVLHLGGLRLSTASTRVELTQFIIDTTAASGAVLTGLVKVNGNVVGRLPLFSLALPSIDLPIAPRRTIVVPNVNLTLTDTAAQALNATFNVNAFAAGIPVGVATVTAVGVRVPGH